MRQIGDILISEEVWQKRFSCDLTQCSGKCCQYGNLGAPISYDEEKRILNLLDRINPTLNKQQQQFLTAGVGEIYKGELHIREIAEDHPCPLSFFDEKKILLCSLHHYALENSLPLLDIKPLWCSLFPIILSKVDDNWIINCHIPKFCKSKKDSLPLLLSFGDLLATFFGKEWIEQVKKEYGNEIE